MAESQNFAVLRCISPGFQGKLIPGLYLGKDGRGNSPFSEAMVLSSSQKIVSTVDSFGGVYEAVPITIYEPGAIVNTASASESEIDHRMKTLIGLSVRGVITGDQNAEYDALSRARSKKMIA